MINGKFSQRANLPHRHLLSCLFCRKSLPEYLLYLHTAIEPAFFWDHHHIFCSEECFNLFVLAGACAWTQ